LFKPVIFPHKATFNFNVQGALDQVRRFGFFWELGWRWCLYPLFLDLQGFGWAWGIRVLGLLDVSCTVDLHRYGGSWQQDVQDDRNLGKCFAVSAPYFSALKKRFFSFFYGFCPVFLFLAVSRRCTSIKARTVVSVSCVRGSSSPKASRRIT